MSAWIWLLFDIRLYLVSLAGRRPGAQVDVVKVQSIRSCSYELILRDSQGGTGLNAAQQGFAMTFDSS